MSHPIDFSGISDSAQPEETKPVDFTQIVEPKDTAIQQDATQVLPTPINFSDIKEPEKIDITQGRDFAPTDASAVTTPTKEMVVGQIGDNVPFDQFMDFAGRLQRGELAKVKTPTTSISATSAISPLRQAAREVATFGIDAHDNPIRTLASFVSTPFTVVANKIKAAFNESHDPIGQALGFNLRDRIVNVLGEMDSDQIDEANRAFNALLAFPIFAAAGTAIGGPVVGLAAGGAAMGYEGAHEGEKIGSGIANALLSIPLGYVGKVMEIPGVKGKMGDFSTEDAMFNVKSVRGLDEVQSVEPKLGSDLSIGLTPKDVTPEKIVAASARKKNGDGTIYSGIVHDEAVGKALGFDLTDPVKEDAYTYYKEENPGLFRQFEMGFVTNKGRWLSRQEASEFALQNGQLKEPYVEYAGEAKGLHSTADLGKEYTGEVAPLEKAKATSEALIESDGNLTATILKATKFGAENDVKFISGVDNPLKAIAEAQKIVPDALYSVYKRPDGKYDIAVGGTKSLLRGNQSQFEKDGYYAGQTVAIDGKHYTYLSSATDPKESWVRNVGQEDRFKVPTNGIRRLPYSPVEVPGVTGNIWKDAADLLDADELKLYRELIKNTVPKELKMEDNLGTNGLYYNIGGAGDFQVRDRTTGELLKGGMYTPEEVHDFNKKTGQTRGMDLLPSEIEYSSSAARALGIKPPKIPTNPINIPIDGLPPKRNQVGGFANHISDLIALRAPWATPLAKYIQAFDNHYQTSLYKSTVHDLQEAHKQLDVARRPWLQRVSNELGKLWDRTSPDRLSVVGQHLQQISADEILNGKLRANGEKPSTSTISYAKSLRDLNVDLGKVKKFVLDRQLELNSLKKKFGVEVLPQEVLDKVTEDLILNRKMTSKEVKASDVIHDIISKDLENTPLFEVLTLAEAWQHKAPTQAEYARLNKMNTGELDLSNKVSQMYKDLAPVFGIEEWRLLNRYIYRMSDDRLTDVDLVDFDNFRKTGKYIPTEKEFAGSMIRSGLLDAYNRDPVLGLVSYVRNGFYKKIMEEKWNDAFLTTKQQLEEGVKSGRMKAAEKIEGEQIINEYLDSQKGIPDRSVQATKTIVGRFLERMGIKVEQDVTRNFTNALLSNTSNAVLGYRVGPAIRDGLVATSFYDMWFGKRRTAGFVKYAVNRNLRNSLIESGAISSYSAVRFFSPDEMYNSQLGKNLKGMSGFLQAWAENGLTVSGQKTAYEMVATGAYGESRSMVINHMSDFLKEKTTKEKFYEKINLEAYPETVARAFDKIVTQSKSPLEAADFLGKETIRMIQPIFGNGNHPRGWATNLGKVAGQYGQYPMWAISMLMDAGSRGSKKAIAGRVLRLAISQSVVLAVGNELGINLTNWLAAPGVIFKGGPITQTGVDMVRSIGGTESERNDARRRLGRLAPTYVDPKRWATGDPGIIFSDPRSLLIPGSFAANDILNTLRQIEQGNPIGAAVSVLGVPVMAPKPWYQDIYEAANTPYEAMNWFGMGAGSLPRP